MFTTDISSALVAFVKDMQSEMPRLRGSTRRQVDPAVCEQVEDIYDYTVAYILSLTLFTTLPNSTCVRLKCP